MTGEEDENRPTIAESLTQLESSLSAAEELRKECMQLLKEVYPNASLVSADDAQRDEDHHALNDQVVEDTEYTTADEAGKSVTSRLKKKSFCFVTKLKE